MTRLATLALGVFGLACCAEVAVPIRDSAGVEIGELESGEAFLEIARVDGGAGGSSGYDAVLVRGDGVSTRRQLPPLDELVESWRAAVLAVEDERVAEVGEQLYTALLEPLRHEFAGLRRLYWSPRGALHGLALDALPIGEGRFVGDLFDVVVGTPVHSRELRTPSSAWTVFAPLWAGDWLTDEHEPRTPSSGGGVPALYYSMHEADALSELYLEVFDEEAVYESAFPLAVESFLTNAPGASGLHIAGQGTANLPHRWDETCECAVHDYLGISFGGVLGSGTRALTSNVVEDLDLSSCGLAFLSCGETALAIPREGQRTRSMATAFRSAGARSVIGSLWPVRDSNNSLFVMTFYDQFWVKRLPVGRALWEAKRVAMEDGAPIRTWAAWVLTGEPELMAAD